MYYKSSFRRFFLHPKFVATAFPLGQAINGYSNFEFQMYKIVKNIRVKNIRVKEIRVKNIRFKKFSVQKW